MDQPAGPNTNLRTEVRQQEVVAELGQQALETNDLDQLMHDASVAVAETLDTDYCKVLELLPGGDEVLLRQGIGWQAGLIGNATVPTDRDSQSGYTLLSEEPVVVEDLRTEERFSGPDLLIDHDVVSGINVIIGSLEEPWGVLGTYTTDKREFADHDVTFVKSVANVLAAAIDRTDKEQRLREQKTQLDVASRAGSIGLWTWDIKEDIVTADEYLAELYGMDPAVVRAGASMETFYEPIHEDDTEHTREQLERTVEETGELNVEFRVRNATGDVIWMVARGEVEYDDGEPARLNGAVADITERKEREQELERALDLLDKTERIADVGGWEIDTETKDVFWTDHIFELLEVTADEEPPLDEALDMYHEEDQPIVEEAVENALEFGDPLDVEVRLRTASGEIRWLRLQGVPETVDGDVVSFRGAAQDITERKRLEDQSEEILSRITDAFYAVDTDFRFTHVNERAAELLQHSEDALLGECLWEVFPSAAEIDEVWDAFHTARDDQEATSYELYYDHLDFWVEASLYPSETGISVYFRDITERVEREQALAESEQRYRTLAEHIPNGIVTLFDTEVEYTLAAGKAFDDLPVSPDQIEGRPVRDVWDEDLGATLDSAYRIVLDGEKRSLEVAYADREWLIHAVPIRDEKGDVFAGLTIAQDITERVEREEALKTSNERLERFAYAASHDLQEPLRMVSSYLQLLERRYADVLDEDGEEFIEFAVDGADRMREMIQGLLEYSRIDSRGKHLEPVDLDTVLADVYDNLQVRIEETDAEITSEDLPRVAGDAGQLRQLFQNLLANAIEYSGDEPPRIHLSVERSGSMWEIAVTDEGIGIGPEQADRIFRVFERLHSREDHPGTGIGLALCQRIVERHGGEIWVESEPGEGSTFSVTLSAAHPPRRKR